MCRPDSRVDRQSEEPGLFLKTISSKVRLCRHPRYRGERRELGSASSGTESAHGLFLSRAPTMCRPDSRVDRESEEPAESQLWNKPLGCARLAPTLHRGEREELGARARERERSRIVPVARPALCRPDTRVDRESDEPAGLELTSIASKVRLCRHPAYTREIERNLGTRNRESVPVITGIGPSETLRPFPFGRLSPHALHFLPLSSLSLSHRGRAAEAAPRVREDLRLK